MSSSSPNTPSWRGAQRRPSARITDGACSSETGGVAIQRKANAAAEGDAGTGIHAAAQAGVAGSGGALPHLDTIQQAFGTHDVSGVEAHVGGGATEASEAIGAEAYATGNQVAFASEPSLHTAAHEAAHVVQQREGVTLDGGIDRPDDAHERRADAVADRVVAGASATELLPAHAGRAAAVASDGVQRKKKKPRKAPPPLTDSWVKLRTPTKVFRETTEDVTDDATDAAVARTFEKTGEGNKGKDRMSLISDETADYLQLVVVDAEADAEPKWIERKKAEKITPWPLKDKTVEVVAPAEVEIPIGTQLKVEADDIEKGRIQVEVDGKREWIGRSHVVVFDATKALPEIKPALPQGRPRAAFSTSRTPAAGVTSSHRQAGCRSLA